MTIVKGGVLVSPLACYQSDVAIEKGQIRRIDRDIMPGVHDRVIDAHGCLVFPGFIDGHTHFDMDNGVTVTADDFESGTQAAVLGGTTTVIDFATQDKGGTLTDALKQWHAKADGRSSCHYGFHMAITDWNEQTRSQLDEMMRAGVSSFKLYLAYDALRVNDAQLLDVLREMKRINGMVGVHCENGDLVNALVARERAAGHLSPAAHPASRPPEVEAEAISRLLYIARLADCPVHIVHLSSALGLEEVRKARRTGLHLYVETCPQYLLLNERDYDRPGFEGAKFVCSPPLRSLGDVRALAEALRDGEIDTIATDHCSYNFEGQKTLGRADFSRIPNGLPGVEHRPALVYSRLVKGGLLTPQQMCRLLSENPARLFGLYPRKGTLREGSDADIVIWDPDFCGVIQASGQRQRVDYTPYEGMRVTGRARTVLLNGEIAVENGRLAHPGLGRYVPRDKFLPFR